MPAILSKERAFDITTNLIMQNKVREAFDFINAYANNYKHGKRERIKYQAFVHTIKQLIPTYDFKSVYLIKKSDFNKSIFSILYDDISMNDEALKFLLTNNNSNLYSKSSKDVVETIFNLLKSILDTEYYIYKLGLNKNLPLAALLLEDELDVNNIFYLVSNKGTSYKLLSYSYFEDTIASFLGIEDASKYNLYLIVDDYAYAFMSDTITDSVAIPNKLSISNIIQRAKQVLSDRLLEVIRDNYHLVPEYYEEGLPYYELLYKAAKHAGYKVYKELEFKQILKAESYEPGLTIYDAVVNCIDGYLKLNNEYYHSLVEYLCNKYLDVDIVDEDERLKRIYNICIAHPEFVNYTKEDIKRIMMQIIKQYIDQIIDNHMLYIDFLNRLNGREIILVRTNWMLTFEDLLLKKLNSLLSYSRLYYYLIHLFKTTSTSKEKDLFTMILILDNSILKELEIDDPCGFVVVITLT